MKQDKLFSQKSAYNCVNGTNHELEGKYISFLGDSITTYDEWSNNGEYNLAIWYNAVYYTPVTLPDVSLTWWKQTIDKLKLNLCVNNSWSGCTVSGLDSSCVWYKRATNLHNNDGVKPDIICIYAGINDFGRGIPLGSFDDISEIYDEKQDDYVGNYTEFAPSYAMAVHKIKKAYKNAEIYLCNLANYNPRIRAWNEVINKIASTFDCRVVDFFNKLPLNPDNLENYTLDYLHPNEKGMEEMSKVLISAILKSSKF